MVKSTLKVTCLNCSSELKRHGSKNHVVTLRCSKCEYVIAIELILI